MRQARASILLCMDSTLSGRESSKDPPLLSITKSYVSAQQGMAAPPSQKKCWRRAKPMSPRIPPVFVFIRLLTVRATSNVSSICTPIKTGYQDSGCCTSNPVATATSHSDLSASLYTNVERFGHVACTPQKGAELMAFPFMVATPIANSVGFNTMSDAAIPIAAVNAVPNLQSVRRHTIDGTSLTGFQTPLTAVPGYNITWLRGDGNFPSDAFVPKTVNTPAASVFDFLYGNMQQVQSDNQFVTLYFVIEASATRCMARYEGVGGMPTASYDLNALQGDLVGTMITDCDDESIKTHFDTKHMVISFDFGTHFASGFATLSFKPWTNPEACLPLKMGLTGWMMI